MKCKGGKIGITYMPQDPNSGKDVESARRALHFQLGWFLRHILSYQLLLPLMYKVSQMIITAYSREEPRKRLQLLVINQQRRKSIRKA